MSWRGLIARGNRYFDSNWRSLWFSPVLYLFLFGAGIRLAVSQGPPPPVDDLVGAHIYHVWLGLLIVSPVASALSAWLILKQFGRRRYWGMWLRLAADVGVLTALLAYHVSAVTANPATESRLMSRYIVAAVMIFTVELILRDVWTLRVVEAKARRVRQ